MSDEQKRKYIPGKLLEIKPGNDKFYASESFPRKDKKHYPTLAPHWKGILELVGIAVDNLDEKKFINFYDNGVESEFKGAKLLPLLDPENNKIEIGFLFSIFYIREEKDENGNPKKVLIGKAFPGIRVEDRLSPKKNKKWDRNWLYDNFLEFYFAEIIEIIKDHGGVDPLIKLEKLSKEDIEKIIDYLLNPSHKIPEMRLEVYIENPLTYNDLCIYDFDYNIKKPTQEFIRESAKWDTAELLRQSFIKTLGPGPEFLEKDIAFSVNITLLEWRKAFEPTPKRDVNGKVVTDGNNNIEYEYNDNIRYYVWQNYYFPNNAFKAIIPLDAYNVWKVIKGSQKFNAHNKAVLNQITGTKGETFERQMDEKMENVKKQKKAKQ
jgi:hypothetical protein